MGPTDCDAKPDTMNLLLSIIGQRRRVFNPLSLSPALWLDASDDATLFDATSGGSLPTNGNDIARWEDKSGNGRHATQSVAASCPHRQTSVQNGLPVVRFDGINDFIVPANSLGVMRNVSGGSIFSVTKLAEQTGTDRTVIMFSRNSSDSQVRLALQLTTGSDAQDFRAGARRLDGDGFTGVATSNNANWNVLAAIGDYAGGQIILRVNGSQYQSNLPSSGNTSDTDSNLCAIGKISNNYLNADVAEIIVFPTMLSTSDRDRVESYLATKWGI